MHFERTLAHIIAGYVMLVGLFFGLADVFNLPDIIILPAGKLYVLGISAVFIALGIGSSRHSVHGIDNGGGRKRV